MDNNIFFKCLFYILAIPLSLLCPFLNLKDNILKSFKNKEAKFLDSTKTIVKSFILDIIHLPFIWICALFGILKEFGLFAFLEEIRDNIELFKSCKNFKEFFKKKKWLTREIKRFFNRKDIKEVEKEALKNRIVSVKKYIEENNCSPKLFKELMKDFKEKRNELKYEFYEDDSLSNEEKIEKYKQEILEYSNYVIILF